jgi:cytochrome c
MRYSAEFFAFCCRRERVQRAKELSSSPPEQFFCSGGLQPAILSLRFVALFKRRGDLSNFVVASPFTCHPERSEAAPVARRSEVEGSAFAFRFILFFALAVFVICACIPAFAQSPDYKNIGRAPTDAEVKAWNIDASPDGKGLPAGSGTAKDGAKIFAEKCAPCHTPSAEGGKLGPALVGGTGTLKSLHPVETVGSYWPFPTTIWDYIHRAMPRGQGGSLEPDEVYSLTAFLLYRNGIVKEDDVLDAKSLPKIQMPNRNNFVPENLNDIWEHNKRACHTGTCP